MRANVDVLHCYSNVTYNQQWKQIESPAASNEDFQELALKSALDHSIDWCGGGHTLDNDVFLSVGHNFLQPPLIFLLRLVKAVLFFDQCNAAREDVPYSSNP